MPVGANGQGVKTKSKSFRMSAEAAAMLKAMIEPKQYASSSLPTMKTKG